MPVQIGYNSTYPMHSYTRLATSNTDTKQDDTYNTTPLQSISASGTGSHGISLYSRVMYYSAMLAGGMWVSWIGWMPLLHLIIPHFDGTNGMLTSTISHTFAKYNTVATIYMNIPMSLLFVFRLYRTFENTMVPPRTKKEVAIILLCAQISMSAVLSYDTIVGFAHAIFTTMSFLSLYIYHYRIRNEDVCYWYGLNVKVVLALCSIVFISTFGIMMAFVLQPNTSRHLWGLICVCEIIGALCLGLLDLVDAYVLGVKIDMFLDVEHSLTYPVLRAVANDSQTAHIPGKPTLL